MRLSTLYFLPCIAIMFLATSCAPKSQEEVALEHVAKRKPGGSFRVINLSSNPLTLKISATSVNDVVPPNEASRFCPVRPGPLKFEIDDEKGNALEAPEVSIESKQGASLLITEQNGAGRVVLNEVNSPQGIESSIHVVADARMEAYTAVIKSPGGQSFTDKLGLDTAHHEDTPGDYLIAINDASGKTVAKTTVTAAAEKAYTVVAALDSKGKVTLKNLLNNPLGTVGKAKASVGSMSGGGGG